MNNTYQFYEFFFTIKKISHSLYNTECRKEQVVLKPYLYMYEVI